MNVLIGCEYSATVRQAFAARGHNAWSCDLLQSEIPGNHYQCDILEAIQKRRWDIIILHLPCTKISICGNSTYGKGMKKHEERISAIEWTGFVINYAKSVCDCVVFENPKNVMSHKIGKRTQAIQPYQFGHPEQKETWLWIWGLEPLEETENVFDEMMKLPKKERERIHYMSPGENRGLERSRFYKGIAKAMAEQWG